MPVPIALAFAALAAGCAAPVARPPAYPSLRAEAFFPPDVAQGEDLAVSVGVTNDGPGRVSLYFGADAVTVRLRLRSPRTLDDLPSGATWEPEHVAVQGEVIAVGYRAELAARETRVFEPLSLPASVPPGAYTLRACARVSLSDRGAPVQVCAPPRPLTVR